MRTRIDSTLLQHEFRLYNSNIDIVFLEVNGHHFLPLFSQCIPFDFYFDLYPERSIFFSNINVVLEFIDDFLIKGYDKFLNETLKGNMI